MEILYSVLVAGSLGALIIALGTRTLPAEEARWLRWTLAFALIVRLAAAAVFAAFPDSRIFHEDAGGYEYFGMTIARAWKGLGPPYDLMHEQNYGYFYFAAAIYYVFGQFVALVSCFSAVIGVSTVLLIYRLTRQFFHQLVARRAALLCSFIPSMILWSSIASKDALVTLLIVIALSCCISLKRRFSVWTALLLAGSLVAIQPVRFYMLYFAGFAVVLSIFLERGFGFASGIYKQLLVVGVFVGLLVMVGLVGPTVHGFESITLERVSRFRHGMAVTASSGFDPNADISTPESALAYLPLGLAELLLGPFPWQFGSLRAGMAAPETIYWWILFPSMLRGAWWMLRKRFASASPLLIFAGTLSCAYALMHGNVGSGFRQRAQIFVVLFIFAALGQLQRRCRRVGLDPDLLLVPDQPARAPAPTPAPLSGVPATTGAAR